MYYVIYEVIILITSITIIDVLLLYLTVKYMHNISFCLLCLSGTKNYVIQTECTNNLITVKQLVII